MTRLAAAAAEYLRMRRALGFKLYHETWWLSDFVAFLGAHGSSTITAELAVRWAQQPADAHPNWWATKLGAIRQFARHYHAYDPRTEIPAPDLLPHRALRETPHIYTDEEIRALLHGARRLRRRMLRGTYATVIGLLAATGMRVGEALALDDQDVDWRRSLVTVNKGKFGKSRELPLHPSTVAALHHYARLRDRLCPRRRTASFFVSSTGKRVLHQNFHHVFLRLVRLCGIGIPAARRPRLHDMRHTFAVKTVRDWYRGGLDVERHLPTLSTYLGHVSPSSTYWYLTGTPELLAEGRARLERASALQP
ncbi:MAG TPA: tyrosine-type recombinase/integrase [Vicinamibacteria bacterium]|jgi:integrase